MNRIKIFILIFSCMIIAGCHQHTAFNPANIELTKIAKIPNNIEFCQIDSVSDGYLISYSRSFAKGGGCGVIKVINSDANINISLYESDSSTISSIDVDGNNIFFIRNDFSEKKLRTLLFSSQDLGRNWTVINTPLGTIRKFLKVDDFLYVEGSIEGTGRFFKSSGTGNFWVEINTLEEGFKSLYLLNKSSSGAHLVCMGSYSFNQGDNRGLLFNTERKTFKSIVNLGDNPIYLKPTSKDTKLHAFLEGGVIMIYSLENDFHLQNKITLPDDLNITNLYIDVESDLMAVSNRNVKNRANEIWISFDKGQHWAPYEHEDSLNLISSSFGALFMIDVDGNIYRGNIKK
ncbi:hypothetical protein COR50_20560 [Chitinophaga caeni]|uniref:Photosynthesis system II assembly factor Ycf48/Hcf136-like domain-containing protein n=2 Tax=Chitinophaga caeni TaxID=2029983 RepID=A0A291QZJ7_9BACT|nr:hypothetical protein COR50_20560 [Chitinophaga caeni]